MAIDRHTEVQELWSYFVHLHGQCAATRRARRKNRFAARFKFNEQRRKLFSDVIDWCGARGYVPRIWLYCLFRMRRWNFPPQLDPAHLMSEKAERHYRELDGLARYRYDRIRNETPSDDAYDPNRDTAPTTEAIKADYARRGLQDLCMRESFVKTLGYHPGSAVCQACSNADPCREQLERTLRFDVMALRRGEITSAAAARQERKYAESTPAERSPGAPRIPGL